jgi:hypothetical protein
MWRPPSGKQQFRRAEFLARHTNIVANPTLQVKLRGSSALADHGYSLAVRHRLSYLLLVGTRKSATIGRDLRMILTGLRRKISFPASSFSGSADTWPPVVRKTGDTDIESRDDRP